MIGSIERDFELLELPEIVRSLPFDVFLKIASNPNLSCSVPRRSECIVAYLTVNSHLSDDERAALIPLYFNYGWAVQIARMFNVLSKNWLPELVKFSALHLSSISDIELNSLTQQNLLAILSSDEIDARNEIDLMGRFQSLTSSSTLVNKHRNKEIWMCWRDASNPHVFRPRPLREDCLRCLVLGSALDDELHDIRETLIANGLSRENVLTFNGDTATPEMSFLLHFDVVLVFTHYQFESPRLVSEGLLTYIRKRGGGLVIAYGFMRNDEWGGDMTLDNLAPCTRGNRCNEPPGEVGIVAESAEMMKDVNQVNVGGIFPRANIKLTEKGTLIGQYRDGIPFCAYGNVPGSQGKIVVLNYYPSAPRTCPGRRNPHCPLNALTARAVKFAAGMETRL
jgi:hypothetical protein